MYVVPLLLALLLIVVSSLIDAIQIKRLTAALILILAILVGTFLTQHLAFRVLRIQERDALFQVVQGMAFAGFRGSNLNGYISEGEVIAIEACAKEVWVYAHDLNWESQDSPFANLVEANLDSGVRYRYLIPETPQVLLRVEQLQKRLSRNPRSRELVKFRAARREPGLVDYSVTIYNPTFLRHVDGNNTGSPHGDTVVVFFPFIESYGSAVERSDILFNAKRGSATARYQERFVRNWDEAHEIDPAVHDL